MEPTKKLAYSVRSSAQALDLSERSIQYLIQQGRLRAVRIGSKILITEDELRRLLREGSDAIHPKAGCRESKTEPCLGTKE